MYKSAFSLLPESIQALLRRGVNLVDPATVVLFGSRARGDHRDNSDFDISFRGLARPEEWSRYQAEAAEEPFTLHKVDLLIYEKVSEDYRRNIDKDGVVLYER